MNTPTTEGTPVKFKVGDRVLVAGEIIVVDPNDAASPCCVAFGSVAPVRERAWVGGVALTPAPTGEPTRAGTLVRVGPEFDDVYVRTEKGVGDNPWEGARRHCAWPEIVQHAARNGREIEVLG